MIDPILPLAVSIAEGRGNCAFFLGSGVSRPAGIPTGKEILRDAVIQLYKLSNNIESVSDKELLKWLKKSNYKDFTYSQILEAFCPSPEERRRFLEKYFIGKNSTDFHRLVAKMVKKNVIKVILTTNFDRLMEKALEDESIDYNVVASSDDLVHIRPREHSNCRIMKLHGDYQKTNIRNTKKELQKLEPAIEKEFQEILDRYGITVIGYSGADEGVMSCFEKRNSKYTLYWFTKDAVNDRVQELIRQQDGRVIKRDNADGFLKELMRKIEIFTTHKRGDAPEFLIQEIRDLIRKNDGVGIMEEIKKYKKETIDNWPVISAKIELHFSRAQKIEELKRFETFNDRLTAIGLILIEYNKQEYFKNLANVIQDIYDLPEKVSENARSPYSYICYIPRAACHNMYYYWSSFALKSGNIDILKNLMDYRIVAEKAGSRDHTPILESIIFWPETFATTTEAFDFLKSSYAYKDFLKDFFYLEENFFDSIYQCNFLLSLYCAKEDLGRPSRKLGIFPNFLRERYNKDRIEKVLVKLKNWNEFSNSIAEKIFEENHEEFIENYSQRCKIINKIVEGSSCDYGTLDCNYFVNKLP